MQRIKKKFVHPNRDQILLLPPELNAWVPEGHFARFLVGVLGKLDFTPFYAGYKDIGTETAGRPPFSPDLMVGLIFYSITKGSLSSRAIEELSYSDVGARYLTGNIQPDHACIARFRLRHLKALQDVFSQIVLLCHQANLVCLQNVALDSTPCAANVAPNTSIAVDKIHESWEKAKARAQEIMDKLAASDKEDQILQKRLQRQAKEAQGRVNRIEQALEFLRNQSSQEAKPEVPTEDVQPSDVSENSAEERRRKRVEIGRKLRDGRLAKNLKGMELAALLKVDARRVCDFEQGLRMPDEPTRNALAEALSLDPSELKLPEYRKEKKKAPSKRVNITDPDCYLTYKPSRGYQKAYLGQVAAESKNQIVIDAYISRCNSDQEYPKEFTRRCKERLKQLPKNSLTDTNYTSVPNIEHFESLGINCYTAVPKNAGKSEKSDPKIVEMRNKLEQPEGKEAYNSRSAIVEPVFARIQGCLGFRRFLYRGYEKVTSEWLQMNTAYNLLRWFAATRR